jgi:hypothetical protein
LEVGAGTSGLSNYLNVNVVSVDVQFPGRMPAMQVSVRADVTKLPFTSGSFDLVISTDMLEHIAPMSRGAAISEMIRVSRGTIYLAFPTGDHSALVDRRFDRLCKFIRRSTPGWLNEHLAFGLPDEEEVTSEISAAGGVVERTLSIESCEVHALLMTMALLPLLGQMVGAMLLVLPHGLVRGLVHVPPSGSPYRKLIIAGKTA